MKVLSFDPERCTGARACEATCAQTWFDVTDPERASIRIHTAGGEYRARFCIQCGACVDVCPVEALWQAPNGVVHVRKNRCVGCMACVGFCPYDVMFADTDHAQPFKCVACGQCVDACPNDAVTIVDVEEPSTALWSYSFREDL
jgi:Fe-S-cluster-containing dehydrogenase component